MHEVCWFTILQHFCSLGTWFIKILTNATAPEHTNKPSTSQATARIQMNDTLDCDNLPSSVRTGARNQERHYLQSSTNTLHLYCWGLLTTCWMSTNLNTCFYLAWWPLTASADLLHHGPPPSAANATPVKPSIVAPHIITQNSHLHNLPTQWVFHSQKFTPRQKQAYQFSLERCLLKCSWSRGPKPLSSHCIVSSWPRLSKNAI